MTSIIHTNTNTQCVLYHIVYTFQHKNSAARILSVCLNASWLLNNTANKGRLQNWLLESFIHVVIFSFTNTCCNTKNSAAIILPVGPNANWLLNNHFGIQLRLRVTAGKFHTRSNLEHDSAIQYSTRPSVRTVGTSSVIQLSAILRDRMRTIKSITTFSNFSSQ